MELSQLDLLEELMLAPSRDDWTTFPNAMNDQFFPNGWNSFESLDQNPDLSASNSSLLGLISPLESNFACHNLSTEPYCPLVDFSTAPPFEALCLKNEISFPIPFQECRGGMVENGDVCGIGDDVFHGLEDGIKSSCHEVEMNQAFPAMEGSVSTSMASSGEKKCKGKKLEGQPSKNLMAERRRRKRLNDRLSMLRSIVPKISKMDRTSILADTIDYMKELLDKVGKLREEDLEDDNSTTQMNLQKPTLRELKPNEVLVRNLPKFDVERRDQETRIEISCPAKPGLLLSTVSTLEALGFDIHQCVISCFNEFSLQASCFEAADHRPILSSEDIKQALFRNAGYGGRCL